MVTFHLTFFFINFQLANRALDSTQTGLGGFRFGGYVGKCREIRRNAERCRERQRDTILDTYVYGPWRDFIADAADEPADRNEYVQRKTDADMGSVRVVVCVM